MKKEVVDHLFRHQYGKMVSILIKFFGFSHLETIEDAIQDTFIKATLSWRNQLPDNPEAWLTQAAKNRTIDLLRQIQAEKSRLDKINNGPSSIQLNELFLEHEIEDSQLRMVFVACHPHLKAEEQIAFALKTISGFSTKEIAAALLLKEETVKKRLSRARKSIVEKNIQFNFPEAQQIEDRLNRVLKVIYLTFNEGFHSTNKKEVVRKDLCGEAIRLCVLLLKKKQFRTGSSYALFALLCFLSARIESKTDENNEIVNLRNQDRSKWHPPLIKMGDDALSKSMEYEDVSHYHFEAFIAAEHLKAKTFEETNWNKILFWYRKLNVLHPSPSSRLNMAMVYIQLNEFKEAIILLNQIKSSDLEQRAYLLYGCYSNYYEKTGKGTKALEYMDMAINCVTNTQEKKHLEKERTKILHKFSL
ncbi:MAG: sigma factor, ECF subfamily protein [Crocinitomicaceae bacterium]|nr:sigma factor, ECF subfamily protein [Crocinitomicaceae bacterium]|tara:strand:- start:16230 stop:17480 length:1251 start_codon:yes stop_codon:yes gene_type:complete